MINDQIEPVLSKKNSENQMQVNAKDRYVISKNDLPLHCPTEDMTLWDSHPRVYISMDTGNGKCPYCGAEYVLNDT
ncbi:MAG: zinc-finger domain-containing protein [Gammaproteobacteria bacterium]|nr:zinc-finger domain-containing protein [Gammaproteobacteria bacterium]